jgi:hypothetical protein
MPVLDWYETTVQALKALWEGFVVFTPKLIGAVLVFIIGWLISVLVGKIVEEVLRKLNLNELFKKGSLKEAIEKAEFKVDVAAFIGSIFKWVFMIVFLLVSVEILGLDQFSVFLRNVLDYLPNVIVAALIFVVAVIIADFTEKVVRAAVEGMKVGFGSVIGVIVRWSIWIFAGLTILYQLKIAPDLIQTILNGIVYLIVLTLGLSFGLGGKDVAAEVLQNLKKKLQR